MSKRNSIVGHPQNLKPLRRSPRFLHEPINSTEDPPDPNSSTRTRNALVCRDCSIIVSKKSSESSNGSRRTTRSNNAIDGTTSLRRSPRLSNQGNDKEFLKKKEDSRNFDNGVDGSSSLRRSSRFCNCTRVVNKKPVKNPEEPRKSPRLGNQALSNHGIGKDFPKKTQENKPEKSVEASNLSMEDKQSSRGVVCALRNGVKAEVGERRHRDSSATSAAKGTERKRKREENSKGSAQGWTREQEMALQRAYFTAKPTPLFWKKVAKLVPGKSAKECFDKVHADHVTPPQPQPRSRANRLNSSPIEQFSLAASKLLQPTEANAKKANCYKHKSHLAQKTVRELLKKHCHIDQDCQADLFSVLESDKNPSIEANQLDAILSTPKHAQVSQGFLRKCRERSSSGSRKPLSRFSGSCVTALVSPPVLKQVKNRALHEKYIDQLHCREAKRKAASARIEKAFAGKENRRDIHAQVVDMVKAAKNALFSDTREAINQLQHLQADSPSNSSDFGDEAVDSYDDEGDL